MDIRRSTLGDFGGFIGCPTMTVTPRYPQTKEQSIRNRILNTDCVKTSMSIIIAIYSNNDQRYKSAPFCKPQVYTTSLVGSKTSKTEKMQGNPHSDAFPQRSTYSGFLDVRTNPKKQWKRRYFVLSNNFLLCGATPYCETLERVTALEGSKIELFMARSQIQAQMGSQSQTQNEEPHQTNNFDSDSKRRSFNLTLRSGKVLYFRALSNKQCDEWQ